MKYFVYLSSFLAVYRQSSLRKAAETLSLSQPAITKHIQSLECKLKQKLFLPKGRGVKPTDYAHYLAAATMPAIDQLDSIISVSEMKRSISVSLDYDLFIKLPKGYYRALQGCQIFFNNDGSERVMKIAQGKYDFAISRSIYRINNLTFTKLFDEKHILVGAPSILEHLATERASALTKQHYLQLNWIASNEALFFTEEYRRVAFNDQIDITPTITIDNLLGVLDLALKGAGVAVLPERICLPYLNTKQIIQLHYPNQHPVYTNYLIYKTDALKNPHLLSCKEYLEETFAKSITA